MFNTTIHEAPKTREYVPYCKEIKEIRAPTDDSVKLLSEMEEKARLKIIDAFIIQTNILKDIACIVYQDYSIIGTVIDIRVKINKKDIHLKCVPSQMIDSREIVEEIIREIAKALAKDMVFESLNTIAQGLSSEMKGRVNL